MNKEHKPWPKEAVDTLPEGYVILGWGGEFEVEDLFSGAAFYPIDGWSEGGMWGGYEQHVLYAASKDSDIVKLNHPWASSQIHDEIRQFEESRIFPTDAQERKEYPVGTFICDYFPHAIAALAHHSYKSQEQHGPATNGAPMEWLTDKSVGDGNEIVRHLMEGDYEAMAWRSLELLERKLTGMEPFNK